MSSPQTTPSLGDLEVAVLKCLWRHAPATAKHVHAELAEQRNITLNTVQSTLERLVRKKLLSRTKRAHAYHYQPEVTRETLLTDVVRDTMTRLGADAGGALAAFLGQGESLDAQTVARLESLLAQQRRSENP